MKFSFGKGKAGIQNMKTGVGWGVPSHSLKAIDFLQLEKKTF